MIRRPPRSPLFPYTTLSRSTPFSEVLTSERIRVGNVELDLLRPQSPEALIDEEAFAHDEFLPYWAELWPAATASALRPAEDTSELQSQSNRVCRLLLGTTNF